MYITNRPDVAKIAENSNVDTVFVDMEFLNKGLRQKNLDSVKNFHTLDDVLNIRKSISKSSLLVRINPIHNKTDKYFSSLDEINAVVDSGADKIMLPYFKTADEVDCFIKTVNGRAKVVLLLETSDAVKNLNDILSIGGIDQVHIGINDLSLCLNKKFMFELFEDGTIEKICNILKSEDILYGIGGIGSINSGLLKSEYIIKEHYRLGSKCAILSRTFCDVLKYENLEDVNKIFKKGISEIRNLEAECQTSSMEYFIENKKVLDDKIRLIKRELY